MNRYGVAVARSTGVAVGGALLVSLAWSGVDLLASNAPSDAYAAEAADVQDVRLDLADANIEKAIALLNAAENPSAKNPSKPFGGHRTKAVSALERARQEITAAKAHVVKSGTE
jgi:hypothetical protein